MAHPRGEFRKTVLAHDTGRIAASSRAFAAEMHGETPDPRHAAWMHEALPESSRECNPGP